MAPTTGATYIASSQEVLVLDMSGISGNFSRVAGLTMVGQGGAQDLSGQVMRT